MLARIAALVALAAALALAACGDEKGLGCGGDEIEAAGLVPGRYELSALPDETVDAFRERLDDRTSQSFSVDGVAVEPQDVVYSVTTEKALGPGLEDIAGQLDDVEFVRLADGDGYVGERDGRTIAIGKLGRCAAVIAVGAERKRTRTLARSLAVGAGSDRREAPRPNTRRNCAGAEPLDLKAVLPPGTQTKPAPASVVNAFRRPLSRQLNGAADVHGVQIDDIFVLAIDTKAGLVGEADLESFPGKEVNFLGRPGRVQQTPDGTLVYLQKDCTFIVVLSANRRKTTGFATKLRLD